MNVIVTGGAGFIGSAFVWKLNRQGIDDILIVDDLGDGDKWKNLVGLRYSDYLHKDDFLSRIERGALAFAPDAVIHMGACSATTERDAEYLMRNNYAYSRALAKWSVEKNARFLYASSAATYGDGARGFDDDASIDSLQPLNMYGYSKHLFDLHAQRTGLFDRIVGLKFFNVFGPNEYHKGKMTSVVYNAYHQVIADRRIRLFESDRADYADGEQRRDFVYIKDCVDVLWWLLTHPHVNGLFNLGTGVARTWNDLAGAVFDAMTRPAAIEYIPLPQALAGKYQYFTQAATAKLASAGCPVAFHSLEDSVSDYVRGYLEKSDRHLARE